MVFLSFFLYLPFIPPSVLDNIEFVKQVSPRRGELAPQERIEENRQSATQETHDPIANMKMKNQGVE